jgi:predicted O-methyltransferase YrrM
METFKTLSNLGDRRLIDAIHKLAASVKGFLDPAEGERLYALALEAADAGPCLEIGSYCGKSAIYLGSACKEKQSTLFSVDHHHGSEEHQPGELYFDADLFDPFLYRVDTLGHFRRTLKAAVLEDAVIPLAAASAVVAQNWATPLSLVFIDGGHAYDTVLSDYRCWHSHLMPHGYLVFHDIYPHPDDGGQAPFTVYRQALASGRFTALEMTGSLGVLQRV